MKSVEELEAEVESLRERLSRLSEASLRINESLDFGTVLSQVVSNACCTASTAMIPYGPSGTGSDPRVN